jgi:hypothetical protein
VNQLALFPSTPDQPTDDDTLDAFARGLLATPGVNKSRLRDGAYKMSLALMNTGNAKAYAFFRALYENADAAIDPTSAYRDGGRGSDGLSRELPDSVKAKFQLTDGGAS